MDCECGASFAPAMGLSARQRHSNHVSFRHVVHMTDLVDEVIDEVFE